MLFTDPLFLFYFLPLALLALRICAFSGTFTTAAKLAIITATLVFYAYGNWLWCGVFLLVIGGTYLCTLLVLNSQQPWARRAGLWGAVAWAVSALGFFKYLNWLVALWPALSPVKNALLPYFGNKDLIVLPPGISFYVFEALSFTIDAYRGRITTPVRWLNYLCFIAMFPRFIAGPIVRYVDMAGQFTAWRSMQLSQGLSVFALGFIIKSLLADQYAVFVPYAFEAQRPDFLQAWAGALAYSMQLYLDFWGYSLMATGLGLCLGFRFPDNFRAPYRAASIGEFWRRWHISLSQWLRDYVYISLGGNRCMDWRVSLNLFLTLLLGGLWHGANFTFVAWGAYHGALLAIERQIGEQRREGIPRGIQQALTLLLIIAGWVLFRANTFGQAADIFAGMLGLHGFAGQFNPLLALKHMPALILALAGLFAFRFIEDYAVTDTPISHRDFSAWAHYLLFGAFILALLLSLSSREIPFLYFQF